MAKRRPDPPPPIPEGEYVRAAMHFATSNLGMATAGTPEGVEDAWAATQTAHAEVGVNVADELRMWLRDIRAGDAYCARAWARFKAAAPR